MEHTKQRLSLRLASLVPSRSNARRYTSTQVEELAGSGVETMKKGALAIAAEAARGQALAAGAAARRGQLIEGRGR